MANWLSDVRRTRATRKPMQRYAGKSDPDPAVTGGWDILSGMPNWTKANEIWKDKGNRDLEDIYRTQVTVYACIRRICIAAQEAPLRIGLMDKEVWKDLPAHPVQPLLDRPNMSMSHAEFSWHLISHFLSTGETSIWKWRNKAGYPTELWPVPTSWVTPRYDNNGQLFAYEMWQGQKARVLVPREDVTRIIFPDPTNLTRGLGPLQAALRDVQTDEERADYIVEMLTNARTPGTILTQPAGWSVEQKDEIRAAISGGLSRGNRGKTLFMEGEGAKIEQATPLKDLDWPGLSALSETRICSAFGVPPIIVGLRSGLETATYSNYEQAIKSFMQGTVVPLWSMLDAGYTRGLLADEGESDGRVEIYHDTTQIRALQEDEDKRADRANGMLAAGAIMRNEHRKLVGLPPLPREQGDVFLMPMSTVEVPAGQAAPTGKPPKDQGTGNE